MSEPKPERKHMLEVTAADRAGLEATTRLSYGSRSERISEGVLRVCENACGPDRNDLPYVMELVAEVRRLRGLIVAFGIETEAKTLEPIGDAEYELSAEAEAIRKERA